MANNIIKMDGKLCIPETLIVGEFSYTQEEIRERQKLRLWCVQDYYERGRWCIGDALGMFFIRLMKLKGKGPREHFLDRLAVLSAGSVKCPCKEPMECTNGWFQMEERDGKLVFKLDVTQETAIGWCTHVYYYDPDTTELVDEAEVWDLNDGRRVRYDKSAVLKNVQPNIRDGKANDILVYDGEMYTKEEMVAARMHAIALYNYWGDDDVVDRAESMREEFLLDKDCSKWTKLRMLSLGGVEIYYQKPIENTPDWDRWFQIETDENGRAMFRFDMDIKEIEGWGPLFCRTVESYFYDCKTLELVKEQTTQYRLDGTVVTRDNYI